MSQYWIAERTFEVGNRRVHQGDAFSTTRQPDGRLMVWYEGESDIFSPTFIRAVTSKI